MTISKKAAAEGALSWYTKQFVVARAARATYGIEIRQEYNKHLKSHATRSHLTHVGPEGTADLHGIFSPLVLKVCALPHVSYAHSCLMVFQGDIVQNNLSSASSFGRSYASFPASLQSFETTLLSIDNPHPGLWCKNPDGKPSHTV